ncbi:hypothetical protein OOT00_08035 [Desulfobotulus sp. H1]|uniref:Uncharacterized protein n=1 Tax=Desulfobotulus pelophilus TaxID=2823377 RepID=A0ABT3NAD9_9BACT|nr:hypothetical protein [Desulfobotulus pelophilus]MCW7753932.1 hypothetical protein [Desulfobotulus pelophilus]
MHATVMDTEYQPLKYLTLPFSQTGSGLAWNVKDFLFPFTLSLESPWQNQAKMQLQWGSLWSFGGIVLAMILYLIFSEEKGLSTAMGGVWLSHDNGAFRAASPAFYKGKLKKRFHEKNMVEEKPFPSGPAVTLAVVAQQNRTNLIHKREIGDRSEIPPFFPCFGL